MDTPVSPRRKLAVLLGLTAVSWGAVAFIVWAVFLVAERAF